MLKELYLGESPANEPCAQIGQDNYHARSRLECRLLRLQIERMNQKEASLVRLVVKSQPHDFGSYNSVFVRFEGDNEEQVNAAYALEEAFPEQWDDISKAELRREGIL